MGRQGRVGGVMTRTTSVAWVCCGTITAVGHNDILRLESEACLQEAGVGSSLAPKAGTESAFSRVRLGIGLKSPKGRLTTPGGWSPEDGNAGSSLRARGSGWACRRARSDLGRPTASPRRRGPPASCATGRAAGACSLVLRSSLRLVCGPLSPPCESSDEVDGDEDAGGAVPAGSATPWVQASGSHWLIADVRASGVETVQRPSTAIARTRTSNAPLGGSARVAHGCWTQVTGRHMGSDAGVVAALSSGALVSRRAHAATPGGSGARDVGEPVPHSAAHASPGPIVVFEEICRPDSGVPVTGTADCGQI
mmetsp:Transcript_2988/g.12234  ORF Transcript_2988/g.12234 Transcript_2988/m.12234 type:complete len:309 (+) Transcript_2988:3961-4887(+)